MGEDFLKKSAKSFIKRRSKEYRLLSHKTLFTNRPEILELEFRGDVITNKSEIHIGENMIGICKSDHLELMYRNQIVGKIGKKQCDELLQVDTKVPKTKGMFSFTITDYSPISQDIYLKLTD